MCSKTKVLCIASWGRSGSTILDNILGQVNGLFSVGELRYIWDRGLIENRLCGCGVPFRECEVWTRILDAFGGIQQINGREIARLRGELHTRHLLLTLLPGNTQRLLARLGEYPGVLERLYQAIHSVTGSSAIVDSSKSPSHLWILGMMPTIDLYAVHLVRDPRGVAYSWLRKKPIPDTGELSYIPPLDPTKSSLTWSAWNSAIAALGRNSPGRYLRIHYEDLVDRPQRTVERILDLVGERKADLSFIKQGLVELDTNHTVSGNPSRFQTGSIELRLDGEWKEKMKRSDKAIVTILTWPLLLRYGYLGRRQSH